MKSFLFLLALGLVSCDKLDRRYLPPPGSKFSGGSPGSLQVPLEFPKETYSTTLRPLTPGRKDNGLISPEDSQLTVGINRGTGLQNGEPGTSQDIVPVTPGPNAPFTYFQNSFKVPTTTTSYAFTQTTTFPPSEGFETTISPISPTGLPTEGSFSNIQQQTGYSQNQGKISPEYAQPGNEPGINGQLPGFGYQSQIPSGQTFFDGQPGIIQQPQVLNQFQQRLHPSSTFSPIHESDVQSPGFIQSPFVHNQGLSQHLGVQPPRQLIGQPGISSTVAPQVNPNYQPVLSQFGDQLQTQQGSLSLTTTPQNFLSNQATSTQFGGYPNIQEINASGSNIPKKQGGQLPTQFTGQQNAVPTITGPQRFPSNQPGPNQYDNLNIQGTVAPGPNIPQQLSTFPATYPQIVPISQPIPNQFGDNLNNIQRTVYPSISQSGNRFSQFVGEQGSFPFVIPQDVSSYQPGSNQYAGDLNTAQVTVPPGSTLQQSGPFQHGQPGANNQLQNQYQVNYENLPQIPSSTRRPTISQNIYRPDSTATSSGIPPGYYNQSLYPSTTPTIPTYGTTIDNIPSSAYPSTSDQGLVPIGYPHRPERPQVESDRNAVILDYKNIITPEGFEYSFDTSNGIHADENGTAKDGVKAQGSYSYTGDDGKFYRVVYSADENGFRPQGDHLPTPPPIPKAIQRVIEQAVKDKEAGITHDGSYDENKYGYKKYQGAMNRYHPQTRDKIITNGADIPDDYDTRFPEGGNRMIGSQSTRRPIVASEDTPDEYDDEIYDSDMQIAKADRDGITKQPGDEPSIRPSNKQTEVDEYEYAGNGKNQIKDIQKPTESRTDSTNQFESDNDDSPRFHPTIPGRKHTMKTSKHRLTGSQEDDDAVYDNESDLVIDRNRASAPNRKPGMKYVDNAGNLKYLPEESFITERPKGTKRPSYSNTIYREESDGSDQEFNNNNDYSPVTSNKPIEFGKQSMKSDDNYENYQKPSSLASGRPKVTKRPEFSSNNRYNEGEVPRRPGNFVSQDIYLDDNSAGVHGRQPTLGSSGQLSNDQQTTSVDRRYPLRAEDGSGYQYIPPHKKFTQGEIDRFPARFPEIEQVSSTKRPSTQPGSIGKINKTIQPFITPNVYRHDDYNESYEDTREQRPSEKPNKPITSYTQTDYEDYDKELESDQGIGDEVITTSKVRPGKPGRKGASSTRRPLYGQQTTASPDDQYTTADREKDNQKSSYRPGQRVENIYAGNNSQENRRPGQRIGSTRRPSHTSVSSTTPMPSYTKQTTQSQYPTTYESDVTVTSSDTDITTAPGIRKPGSPRVPGRPTSRPDSVYTDRTRVPSPTTLRPETSKIPGQPASVPIVDYSDEARLSGSTVRRPGVSSATSRPTNLYFDKTTVTGSTNIKPGSSRPFASPEYYNKNFTSSSVNLKPGTSSKISPITEKTQTGNLPSTTYRPNYTFADITTRPALTDHQSSQSGKVVDMFGRRQPESSQQGQLGQQRQPGQTGHSVQQEQAVDQFGRPQLGQSGQQGQIIEQFGRPQSAEPVQLRQPGEQGQIVDQSGKPRSGSRPGYPGQSGQKDQIGQSVGQFPRPQPGQIEQPAQLGQSGQSTDQFRQPQAEQFGQPQPGQQGRPVQLDQPGQSDSLYQNIDQFGRPIPTSQSLQEIGSTYRPDFSITPAQGSSPNYNDGSQSFTPGVVTFKPTEPRFGSKVPNESGPARGQLGPYGTTSTERVIGEDFTGPKQPQRFDPETGYHY